MNKLALITLIWLVASYCQADSYEGTTLRIDPLQLERRIHQEVNRERQKYGLGPLEQDEKLTEIARNHSQDMARYNFFSHINPRHEDPTARGKRQGWNEKKQIGPRTWKTGLAENIFLNSLYNKILTTRQNGVTVSREYLWNNPEQLAQTTVQGWMDSPAHRRNILSPQIDRQGIGVAISGNDVYVTEDLF
jgi:uncharacterized protein YkwD